MEPARLVRHGVLWLVICSVAAIPSFWMALSVQANIPAMIVGVLLFVLVYTLVSTSSFSDWIKRKRVMFRAVQLGFGLRLVLSAIAVLSIVMNIPDSMKMTMLHDGMTGQIALESAKHVFGYSVLDKIDEHMGITFIATLLQGVLLNLLLLVAMAIFYGVLKLFVTIAAILSPKGEAT